MAVLVGSKEEAAAFSSCFSLVTLLLNTVLVVSFSCTTGVSLLFLLHWSKVTLSWDLVLHKPQTAPSLKQLPVSRNFTTL